MRYHHVRRRTNVTTSQKGGERDEDSPQGRSHAPHRDAARKQGQPGLRLAAAADAHDERPLPAGEVRAPAEADLGGRQACPHVRGRTDRVLGPRAGRGDLLPPGRSADTRPRDRRPRHDQLRCRSFRCPWCHEGDHRAREVTLEKGESMRGTVLYAPRDVRCEEREEPRITTPTDAIIRMSATCVCGSDLWPYRGIEPVTQPTPFGHEYCGIVEEVGSAVESTKPGQFVIGSFFASDNTCPHCRAGYQSSCQHREFVSTAQAPLLRVALADGTLVATPEVPSADLIPSFLAVSDVMGTGWFAAVAANVKPGATVAVVGDGAVGLLGGLSAKQMGAGRIIAMRGHAPRQKLARELGATDIVTERGNEAVARIKELTKGNGAVSVLECVGTQESMMQAIGSTRPGGAVGYVGVPHGVDLDGEKLFYAHVHLHGGPAPVRRFLPELIDLVWKGKINPGKVFDLTLPLDQVAEGYRAMDERRAIKTLLRP